VVVEGVDGAGIKRLEATWRVIRAPDAWQSPQELSAAAVPAVALVVRNRSQVTRDLLQAAPNVVVVARAGVGLDNIDLAAADELGVVVVAAAGANAASVAEHALALALAVARRIPFLDGGVRSGTWERSPGTELAGRCWGVVGLGATGRATARLAAGIGMEVVGHDPFLPADTALEPAIRRTEDLSELLNCAEVVSLHLAASEASRGIVDEAFLARMKPGSYLINVARGELVDEEALLAALSPGHLGGAGLDVRITEPPGAGDPLALHPLVVSTPHIAGITGAAQERVIAMISADLDRVLLGEEAHHAAGRHRVPARRR
jgi:D-3-phosphoglycerate dehydrogenase/(S)-sulfolactate dehydrogenase